MKANSTAHPSNELVLMLKLPTQGSQRRGKECQQQQAPDNAPQMQGGRLRGAARGAAGGAEIGAIAGDAGVGVCAGAVAGTMRGGMT